MESEMKISKVRVVDTPHLRFEWLKKDLVKVYCKSGAYLQEMESIKLPDGHESSLLKVVENYCLDYENMMMASTYEQAMMDEDDELRLQWN
jgi:hypothetical protein